MVKRQKERLYQTSREERLSQQQRSGDKSGHVSTTVRNLPFSCCALTLNPYNNPVCCFNGIIFENSAIIPYLLKHKKDPVTGLPMSSKDLITLHIDKDDEGKWQCPVLLKPFSEHVKIVAIRQNPPGNEAYVYSYEAVEELNIKPKNYQDLTTGKPFNKNTDMIILHDPLPDSELHKLRDINTFQHIASMRDENRTKIQSTQDGDINHTVSSKRIMEQIHLKRSSSTLDPSNSTSVNKVYKIDHSATANSTQSAINQQDDTIYIDELIGVQYTTGKTSGSFTSTSVSLSNKNEVREATEEEIRLSLFQTLRQLKKKGYVRLKTNFGSIDVELHCDITPRTCTNFIGLVELGKYNGCSVHRLIPNFMVQMGKPTEKKEEETSFWGEPFVDEFDDRLKHDAAGILSMANAGPGTNRRQFFITFRNTPHLDRKHTVFGKVLAGMDVLRSLEKVPTDDLDRPSENIKIIEACLVGTNPVQEAVEIERHRIQARKLEKRKRFKSN